MINAKVVVSVCLIIFSVLDHFQATSFIGVLPLIQKHYNLKDAETGTMHTAASTAHTGTLALVWIFGDLFKRRTLFLVSASLWLTSVLLSLILGLNSFVVFLIFHTIAAGIASVTGILIPVILADLLQDRELGVALMFLQIAELSASMFNDVISSWIVTSTIPWQTSIAGATSLAIIPLVLVFCLKKHIKNVDTKRDITRRFTSAFGFFKVKSYLLMIAERSFGQLHGSAYGFWYPSVYLLAFTIVPQVFLGLSYTTITALNTAAMLSGTILGMPTILWFAQSWRHGTGLFSGRQPFARAYPIVTGIGSAFNILTFVAGVVLMDKYYIPALVNSFFVGFTKSAGLAVGQQMMFAVVPASSRASANALGRLISGTIGTPAAQIFGFVSDAIRGDSMLPEDRFHAYQLVLLGTSIFLLLGTLCHFMLIVVYPNDCERAEEMNREEAESVDEKTPLNGKGRTESILDAYERSRTTTMNSLLQ